ncbi:MAG TPA: hypothetical protein VK993_16970 [Chthoniobacterales bacterium]|nr:hypothetical protein [Chthoniobacterales bacterium]
MSLLLASSAIAQESDTAYEALRVVGTQLNRGYLDRVLSVSGAGGDPQPRTWRIDIADRAAAGGFREVDVTNGRIAAQRTPMQQATAGSPIKTSLLNLDSNGAYTVAAYTADKSHVLFSSASYTLRPNARGIPVWMVTLFDNNRQPVGTIHIAANKGNVTRVEGMFRGTNDPQVAQQQPQGQPGQQAEEGGRVQQQPRGGREMVSVDDEGIDYVDEDEEDENFIKREIKLMFRRTKRDAQQMFARVRSSFDDFMERAR